MQLNQLILVTEVYDCLPIATWMDLKPEKFAIVGQLHSHDQTTIIIANHRTSFSSCFSVCHPRAFHCKQKSISSKTPTLTHLILFLPTLRLSYTRINDYSVSSPTFPLSCARAAAHDLRHIRANEFFPAQLIKITRQQNFLSFTNQIIHLISDLPSLHSTKFSTITMKT